MKEVKSEENKKEKKKKSLRFVYILSIVSVLGFFGIFVKTLFLKDISVYIESLWLFFFGIGLLIEANLNSLFKIKKTGISQDKFRGIVTAVLGFLALLTALFVLPEINLVNQALLAIEGVISLIAMVFIIIQTLVLKE